MPAVLFIELTNLLDILRQMPVISMAARDKVMATGPARRRLQSRAPVANTKPCILYFFAMTRWWILCGDSAVGSWTNRFKVATRSFFFRIASKAWMRNFLQIRCFYVGNYADYKGTEDV